MATFQATTVNGAVVLFDGTNRIVLKIKDGPFALLDASALAGQIAHTVEALTVETFAPALGAGDADAGLEDL